MLGEKGSSKADTLVKVVLVFFISLLSFSVGTFVGKQVSDSEHRKIALEGEFKGEGREVASEKEEHGEGHEAGKISEKEVANLTEEFVNKDGDATAGGHASPEHAQAAHGEAHDAKPEADGYKTYAREGKGREIASDQGHDVKVEGHEPKAEAAHDATKADAHDAKPADATHHVAEKVAEGKAPSDGAHETPKPAAGLPSVASSAVGKYTVQVASYASEKEAKDHASKLKGKGFQAFYLPAKVNGKEWYRVLVGLFSTVKSADEYKAQLVKDGGTKAAYVQKIVQ